MLLSLELKPGCSKYWDNCDFASMFLVHLVQSHESDKEHADANRLKVLKYMEVSGMLETEEIQDRLCYGLYGCDSKFPQVFDFLCSLDPKELLSISRHDFSSLYNGSLWCSKPKPWDFSTLSNYIKAGFKYFPDLCGILFLQRP